MSTRNTRTPVALALLGLAAILAAPAHAADFKAGDWDLSVGGIVNAYYTSTSCSGDQGITGLALAGQALGCGGKSGRTTIGNGLLPNALTVGAKTRQDGIDVAATLMIGAAVSSSDAISNNNNVDVRQGFLTFGNADMGTVKLGRDYGLFGLNAVLSDMTLIGAGAPVNATQANRVTLGHIGAGYSYPGNYGQIAYSLPAMGAFGLTAAVMSPVDAFANATYTGGKSPQLQLQATFALTGGKLWAAAKSQQFDGSGATPGFTMQGFELGGSYTAGAFGLLANVQSGKGLGVLADGDNGPQKQDATLVQATFQATPKVKLGLGYGVTNLKDAAGAALHSNSNTTLGLYYSMTKSLTLVGEVSQTQSKSAAGASAKMDGLALGAIVFF
jgi:predicted porin